MQSNRSETASGRWSDQGLIPAQKLCQGLAMQIERKGFRALEVTQEA